MKIRKEILGILAACLAALSLVALGIYIFFSCHPDDKEAERILQSDDPVFLSLVTEPITEEDVKSSASTSDAPVSDTTPSEQSDIFPGETVSLPEHRLIFVGDSRTVGMETAEKKLKDPCIYIGEPGEGYIWFEETGLSMMSDAISENPECPVVINLGVNDPWEIDRYLALYQDFSAVWPDTVFYYMSVNPVTEEAANITNEEIAAFNEQLKNVFPDSYLDCNLYMKIHDFESIDGVHYSSDTYCMIHDFAVQQIFH